MKQIGTGWCFLLFILTTICYAGSVPENCFNFENKITKPIQKPLPLIPGKDNFAHGVLKEGTIPWGAARAVLNLPIQKAYKWLLNHENWKDMTKTELVVKEVKSPHYLDFHEVSVDLNVFLFISVSWREQWAYTLLSGTPKDPKEILISYQKQDGTSHLEHLCGSIVLKKLGPQKTDISFHEQSIATHYSGERIVEMHVDNLRLLRLAEAKKMDPIRQLS